MSIVKCRPVRMIAEPDRQALENMVGAPLTENQYVVVMVFEPGELPDDQTLRAAEERIRQTLVTMASPESAGEISIDEFDAAVDAALQDIWQRPN